MSDPVALAAELRHRLGPAPELPDWPLVSVVVPNRDGASHLPPLLSGLSVHTDYPHLELILVDNASRDESLDFIRTVETPFPISILANVHNESFSDACNQGAELARGEILLFLNNDVEPFEPGWLRELVACLRRSGAGAVAATLLCPDEEQERRFSHGYGVQHRGLELREQDEGMIHPVLHGWEADPLDERLGADVEPPAVAAACLLIERQMYADIGGFSHGYMYGAEDVDLSLKLRAAGRQVMCSGRALVIHHPASTRRRAPFVEERARKLANRHILWERWGPRLRRDYEEAQMAGEIRAAPVEWPSYCLMAADSMNAAGEEGSAELLAAIPEALEREGRRFLPLEVENRDELRALNYDIAVYFRGPVRHVPKPGQLNVLWVIGEPDALTAIECSRYDLVLTGHHGISQRLLGEGLPAVTLIALDVASPAELARSSITAIESRAEAIGAEWAVAPAAP